MGINYEMARYEELTGQDGTSVSISRLGGYLDGYEKGVEVAIKAIKDSYVFTNDEMKRLDTLARQLKGE
nr:MAG TPA: hypothetical protein [Caudoviricetes sp.]